jgi:hypothetical protein
MVPAGPNPLHNYSNISSEVIGIPWSTRGRYSWILQNHCDQILSP